MHFIPAETRPARAQAAVSIWINLLSGNPAPPLTKYPILMKKIVRTMRGRRVQSKHGIVLLGFGSKVPCPQPIHGWPASQVRLARHLTCFSARGGEPPFLSNSFLSLNTSHRFVVHAVAPESTTLHCLRIIVNVCCPTPRLSLAALPVECPLSGEEDKGRRRNPSCFKVPSTLYFVLLFFSGFP